MILKVSHNIRLTPDLNISVATEGIVDSEDEAQAMGEESAKYMMAYINSFGDQFSDEEEDE